MAASANVVVMQTDGNLCLYNSNGNVWCSNTVPHANAYLSVQDDGHIVMRDGAGQPYWSVP